MHIMHSIIKCTADSGCSLDFVNLRELFTLGTSDSTRYWYSFGFIVYSAVPLKYNLKTQKKIKKISRAIKVVHVKLHVLVLVS